MLPSSSGRLAAPLLLSLLLAGCGGSPISTSPTQTPAAVDYFPGELPQWRLAVDGRQVMLTVLADDLVHVAFGERLQPGLPYLSPMISGRSFDGPTAASHDAAAGLLTTPALTIRLVGSCWQVDSPSRPLTRICVDDWSDQRISLKLSREGGKDIYGLGQQLSSDRLQLSWLGLKRESPSPFGNVMGYSSIMATGDTQVPVAYVLGEQSDGYGLFVDSPYALRFDFQGDEWTVESADGRLGLLLFSGRDLAELRRDYLALTGTPPVPPLKAFGLWISEYGYDSWQELDSLLATLRQQQLPVDGAVLDLQWYGGISKGSELTATGGLDWDERNFPEPRQKLARYAQAGLGIMVIEQSYVGGAQPVHHQLADKRLLAMDCPSPCTKATRLESNPWWGIGGMLDWSNPKAREFWHDRKRVALIEDGVLGHWTDLGEPELYDSDALYAGYDWYGETVTGHRDIHNLYNFHWSQGIAENTARSHADRRTWILSRSGTAGSQRFGVALWSGDVATSFAALAAHPAAQGNMSLSGFDYYGSDVGGFHRGPYRAGPVLDSLYTRWLANSVLSDIPLRPHANNLCNCTHTTPDRVGDVASNRANLQLRYRLAPYLYSLAHQAWAEGEAIFPPLPYHFPLDAGSRNEAQTHMIGPWLATTAIIDDKATVSSYLPVGRWLDFHRPDQVRDGGRAEVAVLQDGVVMAPLYLREGAIVPLLATVPDYLARTDQAGVNWFQPLLIRAQPAATESRFVLVEDDGLSRAYERGQVARTTITTVRSGDGSYQLTLTPDNQSGETASRSLSFELLGAPAQPSLVEVNGQPLPALSAGSSGRGWLASRGGITVQLGEVSVDAPQRLVIRP